MPRGAMTTGTSCVRNSRRRSKNSRPRTTACSKNFARLKAKTYTLPSATSKSRKRITTSPNLYVASYQLYSTLDSSEVVKVILEIVINLIGAEIFCVYVCEEGSGVLAPVAAEGDELALCPPLQVGEGFVGESVAAGKVAIGNPSEQGRPPSQGGQAVVSIPLRVDDRPVGAIVIYKLLQQKDGFSALGAELFTLLAGHAATAVFASQLYAQSEPKLSTIQGAIDLLTN